MRVLSDAGRGRQPNILLAHMYLTYIWLRGGLAVLAIALPPLLWFGSGRLETSISAYYWVEPMRDWLVGILWAVAAGLILYRGFSVKEDLALNAAGICAIGIAIVPTEDPRLPAAAAGVLSAHGTFAMIFFLCLAYVAIARAKDTLDDKHRAKYLRTYQTLGWLMILLPLSAVALTAMTKSTQRIFWVECLAIYTFAAYWTVKSIEMWSRTKRASRRLLKMRVLEDLEQPYWPAGGSQSSTLLPSGSITHANLP